MNEKESSDSKERERERKKPYMDQKIEVEGVVEGG